MIDEGSGMSVGLRTILFVAAVELDLVSDRRRGRDQREVELALEPLAHDLHMQEPEEPAPEAEAERAGRLRFEHEGGVVQLQLVECVAQHREVVAVDRIDAGVDHRLGLAVAGQRFLGAGASATRDGVADLRLATHP